MWKGSSKEEFDLEVEVNDFLKYYISKKHSSTKHSSLDIISAASNHVLIQEAIENRKKENREIFEIDKIVKISNFLRIDSEKICRSSKSDNSKEKHEKNWKMKGKSTKKMSLLQSAHHCKRRRDYRIKERTKMENSN